MEGGRADTDYIMIHRVPAYLPVMEKGSLVLGQRWEGNRGAETWNRGAEACDGINLMGYPTSIHTGRRRIVGLSVPYAFYGLLPDNAMDWSLTSPAMGNCGYQPMSRRVIRQGGGRGKRHLAGSLG